jgi:PKD repeat protein
MKNGKLSLIWNSAIDNIAVNHYKIYRDNIFLLNRTMTSYQDTELTNGQSYSYTVSAVDMSGNEGNLSDSVSGTPTKSSSGGGGGGGSSGGGGGSSGNTENVKPIAKASTEEPYQGLVSFEILFNGSRSSDADGTIITWLWMFGDNTNGTGKTVRHTYQKAGTYTVTLTVTDNKGATNTDTTTCVITQPNRPPIPPTITGPVNGTKNTLYTYTVVSTDPDNDTIQYTIDWGDPLSLYQLSGFLPNGSVFTVNHSWVAAGRFNITVTVTDNHTTSSSTITVYIDAIQTGSIGYLLDNSSDEIYDAFYSDVSKQITPVQEQNGKYSIDSDGDGDWDFTFDAIKGLTVYQESKTPGFEFVFVLWAMMILFFWEQRLKKES